MKILFFTSLFCALFIAKLKHLQEILLTGTIGTSDKFGEILEFLKNKLLELDVENIYKEEFVNLGENFVGQSHFLNTLITWTIIFFFTFLALKIIVWIFKILLFKKKKV